MKTDDAIDLVKEMKTLCTKPPMMELLEKLEKQLGACPWCQGKGFSYYGGPISGNGYKEIRTRDGVILYQYDCKPCFGKGQILTENCFSCGTPYRTEVFGRERIFRVQDALHYCDTCYEKVNRSFGVAVPTPVPKPTPPPTVPSSPPKQPQQVPNAQDFRSKGKR